MTTQASISPQTQTLDHGITRLDAEYVEPGVASMYLLRENDRVAIIETGTSHCVPTVLELLQQWGLSADAVDYVIPTHVHLDHAGGAGALIQACPNAKLVVHPRGARHMIDPTKLIEGTIAVYGEVLFKQLYGELIPVPAERVIEAPDNFELDLSGRTLKFLDTPGHARHHFCIYDAQSNGFFTGDTFGLCYPDLETDSGPFLIATTTPVQFEPEAMVSSIDRMLTFNPDVMYLTHFGPLKPEPALVNDLKDSLDQYTSIAQSEKTPVEGRAKRIEEKMMSFLISRLEEKGLRQTEKYCCKKLAIDVRLNSEGLDIWLKRQES